MAFFDKFDSQRDYPHACLGNFQCGHHFFRFIMPGEKTIWENATSSAA